MDAATDRTDVNIAIVGTGFAGLGMAIRLKQAGHHDFVVLERAHDVGGTWRDNTYPGAACDVPSQLYSFSFALNPGWTRSFSPQPEIFDYLRSCARRFGVTPHVRFGHEVEAARWDGDTARWLVDTSAGRFRARVLISGMGALSEPRTPPIPGIESFPGTIFHSATWNHGHDLTGERVAAVGTGASSIQFVPQIQPRVDRLHLFQRTPPWVMPRLDRHFTRLERWLFRHLPGAQRLWRNGIYWGRESYVVGFTKRPGLLKSAERIARAHLRRQVPDPELRARLTPDYTMGCKRILISDDYYPSLNQPNVELVPSGISEIRDSTVVATDGTEREVDTIIFGTGFHVTDIPAAERVWGRDGVLLRDAWRHGMAAHKGTAIAGFPNLFMLVGPNTGLGHTSMVVMIEAQIGYVMDALRHMESADLATVEVRQDVQDRFNEGIQKRMEGTVWTNGGCGSWYLDEHGRNTTLWPGFTWRFRRLTERFDPERYAVGREPVTMAPSLSSVSSSAPE